MTRHIMALAWAAAALQMVLAGNAFAAPNKCVDATGKVTYTDLSCPSAKDQRELTIVDNSSDSAEVRKAILNGAAAARGGGHGGRNGGSANDNGPSGAKSLTPPASPDDLAALARTCPARKRDYEIAVTTVKKDLSLMNRRYVEAAKACGPELEVMQLHERLAAEDEIRKKQAARGGRGGRGNTYVPPIVIE
ncbi:hypothetical protein BH09PSE5_BH09PSE5_23920 [soil metagenome]